MMNARAIAEDAASWYLSTLDPHASHAKNVQKRLRGPVFAITLRVLRGDNDKEEDDSRKRSPHQTTATTPLDPAAVAAAPQSEELAPTPKKANGLLNHTSSPKDTTTTDVTDDSNNDGAKDWKHYLTQFGSSFDSDDESSRSSRDKRRNNNTDGLSRRARARADAFLQGCALALPDDPLPPASASMSKKEDPSASSPTKAPAATSVGGAGSAEAVSLSTALSGFSVGGKPSAPSDAKPPSSSSGENGSRRKDFLRQISHTSPSKAKGKQSLYPQFQHGDLMVRLELYVRSLRRVRESLEECVINLEPPRAIKARVENVLQSFIATVGCVRSIRPVLTALVQWLTKELLAVDLLGEKVLSSIERLVSEYEHQTSFASFAFLSTPEESAGTHLSPLLSRYVQYLKNDWQNLVSSCELERMLSTAIEPSVRKMFKTIEFQSIGHLLEICFKNRKVLENIELPPSWQNDEPSDIAAICNDTQAVRQALRDLGREVITVNGRILPPARSLKELARLLSQTLNSRNLTLSYSGSKKSRKKLATSSGMSSSAMSSGDSISSFASGSDTSDLSASDGEISSSGNEGDTDGTSGSRRESSRETLQAMAMADAALPPRSRNRSRRPSLDYNTIDLMTRRLLLAAGRTGTGGDAFFVVRDLFGGDDVEVIPSNASSSPSRAGRPARNGSGTIELIVRLTSITIKCHGRYDVYPKPLSDDYEPLITLHTTTTETISLQEVRTRDLAVDSVPGRDSSNNGFDGKMNGASELMLREKKTDRTGWRALSLRPALYETVQVWNTPS